MLGLRDFIAMLEWLVHGDDGDTTEADAKDEAAGISSAALSQDS